MTARIWRKFQRWAKLANLERPTWLLLFPSGEFCIRDHYFVHCNVDTTTDLERWLDSQLKKGWKK